LFRRARARQHRHDGTGHGSFTQRRLQRRRGDRLALDERGRDGVVEVRRRLDQLLVGGRHRRRQRGGDLLHPGALTLAAGEVQRLLLDQVDHPLELILGPDGQLDGHRTGAQAGADLLHHRVELRAARSILLTNASRGT
jgi:hypothetical protein